MISEYFSYFRHRHRSQRSCTFGEVRFLLADDVLSHLKDCVAAVGKVVLQMLRRDGFLFQPRLGVRRCGGRKEHCLIGRIRFQPRRVAVVTCYVKVFINKDFRESFDHWRRIECSAGIRGT